MRLPAHWRARLFGGTWQCRVIGHWPGPEHDSEPTAYGVRAMITTCQRCGAVIKVTLINDGGDPPPWQRESEP